MLTNENTVISVTAFNDPESLNKTLQSICKYNKKGFPIYVHVDKKDTINEDVIAVCSSYTVSYIITTRHLLPTVNKLKSLYYIDNYNAGVDYIFSFEDDIEIGSQYFEVMEDLMLQTGAEIVNSMNFDRATHIENRNKYCECINHLWQFLIRADTLRSLDKIINKYLSMFNEHDTNTDAATLAYMRDILQNTEIRSHKVDFLKEANNNPTAGWDAAMHWFIKVIDGFKYTTVIPHCRPILRNGYNYTKKDILKHDKHLTNIEHNLELPINWALSTVVEKE